VVLPAKPAEPEPAEALAAAADSEAQEADVDPTAGRATSDTRTGNRTIEQARQALDSGKVLEARQQLNALLKTDLGESESGEVRALLTRIADDTIFGRRHLPGDPLLDSYTIQSGDVLLNIGRDYHVPHEILMQLNGIPDATKIRQGQKLKVPRGPFHVKIYKSEFRMDVYLQDVYVRSYRVGLGTDNGTPEGVWKVKTRLENPTYYPPSTAADKRILAPDDPNNPLGRRWIGLEGVEGAAVGHEGYGIHGTIEPDSIGKAVSLGCIRMHNEDVAFLYMLMMPGQSTVTILP
jgi:LysM repeat protein